LAWMMTGLPPSTWAATGFWQTCTPADKSTFHRRVLATFGAMKVIDWVSYLLIDT
jgi:hypothetical protein